MDLKLFEERLHWFMSEMISRFDYNKHRTSWLEMSRGQVLAGMNRAAMALTKAVQLESCEDAVERHAANLANWAFIVQDWHRMKTAPKEPK